MNFQERRYLSKSIEKFIKYNTYMKGLKTIII